MTKPWDAFITDRDRKVFADAGYGVRGRFPDRPALLLIDFIVANADLPGFDTALEQAATLAQTVRAAGPARTVRPPLPTPWPRRT